MFKFLWFKYYHFFKRILLAFQSSLTPLICIGNLSAALNLRRRESSPPEEDHSTRDTPVDFNAP